MTARQLGVVSPVARDWYCQAGAGDPREVAAVRCHCTAGGRLVVLREVVTDGHTFRVGQCPGCRRVVWAGP